MKQIEITRVFPAPRAVGFGWWSDAKRMQSWSGCKDCTRCEIDMDFRAGGGFTQRMRIRDECDFTVRGYYDEIVVPERIVYRADLGIAVTRVVVKFSDVSGGTKVLLKQDGFPDDFTCEMVIEGTRQSFDSLETIFTMSGRA